MSESLLKEAEIREREREREREKIISRRYECQVSDIV